MKSFCLSPLRDADATQKDRVTSIDTDYDKKRRLVLVGLVFTVQ
jgi:hypothetical protein